MIKVKNEAELQEALKKANANDTIEIDANATISKDVTLSTNNAIEINVKGDLTGKVTVKTPNADIKNSGTIGTLVVENGKNTTVTNTSAGKISKVEVSSSSENVKVENNGTITEVKNDGEGTKVDNEGTISKPITGTETPNVEGNKPGGSTGGGGSSSGGGSASYDKIPTDAISLNGGNFNTHKGNNYTGVNVGWSLKDGLDFNDIKSIEVELYAGNKKLVTNVAEGVALEKHKELYSGETRVFSTPFAFGEFKDDYWAFGNWEENIKEALTKATIIINGKAGDKVSITTTSGLSSTEGTKWEQLFDNKEIPTDAIILENFNTHKGTDYTGVNVGWFLKEELNFDDIKSIEVELYSGTEKLATNTAVLEKHAELYKTTKQFSTPFAFDGFEDEYWTFSEWNEDKAKKPTSAKVIIKGKAGDTVVATNNGPLSTTSGTEWYNLFENKAIPTGAITLEKGNFNTHKGDDYTGVNVGWSLADNLNFNDIKRIKVELYADTTLLATNVAEGNILAKHRNLYNKNTRVFSTPFIVKDGSYKEEYWALGKWNPSKEKAPTKAKIIIEGKTGNPESIETNAELAAEAGKSWTELFSN